MSQVKPITQTVLLWITKSLWNNWKLISTKPSTAPELHCHGSTAHSPCVQATHAEFPLTSFTSHTQLMTLPQLGSLCYLKCTSNPRSDSQPGPDFRVSSRLIWLGRSLVSHTSSLLYCPLYDIFPSNPPHCRPDGLLKTPKSILLFSVSSWAESPKSWKVLYNVWRILLLGASVFISEETRPSFWSVLWPNWMCLLPTQVSYCFP